MVKRVSSMLRRRHQGSAALITTIAISSILVVLFVGITSIATREIRQSIDADNSNRALYAAEAGVEDAMRRLAENPNFRELGCNSPTANTKGPEQPVGANTAWTCRTVTTESAELTGKLDIDESLNINLGRARDASNNPRQPYFMVLEWNDPNDPANSANPVMTGKSATWLPTLSSGAANDWTGAAAMEITTTWLERSGGQVNAAFVNKSNLTGVLPVRTALASPSCGVGPCPDISTWTNPGVSLGATNLRSNITTRCDSSPSKEYSCVMPNAGKYDLRNLAKAEINDGTNNVVYDSSGGTYDATNMFLRIRPRYNNASYRIRFYASDGTTQLLIPDGNATIDVTARSGDYYRRVIAKKQLQPSIMDGVFDNAIFSGANICKDLRIYRDYRGAPDFNTNVVPRTPNNNAGKNTCDGNS